jgi:prepilin-type processing-associated H-X9-DG protein
MRRAFTLLEILLGLGVVLLLAAVAVPSLQVARARADSAKCVSHLRSLGVSLNLYLADHEMRLPDMEAGRATLAEDVPVLDTVLLPYVDDHRVFACPADREIAWKSGTSYYYNSALRGQPLAGLRLFWISDPGKIPVLVDKEGWHHYVEDKVNHLFADGHVTNELRLIIE